MKQRQKERKLKKAFAQIEKVNKQIDKLEELYTSLKSTFGEKHPGVITQAIRLEYMRSLLNAKKEKEHAIIRELNK